MPASPPPLGCECPGSWVWQERRLAEILPSDSHSCAGDFSPLAVTKRFGRGPSHKPLTGVIWVKFNP